MLREEREGETQCLHHAGLREGSATQASIRDVAEREMISLIIKHLFAILAILSFFTFSANAAELTSLPASGDNQIANTAPKDDKKEDKVENGKGEIIKGGKEGTKESKREEKIEEKPDGKAEGKVKKNGADKLRVCILSVCEEDPTMEASIREMAETAILRLKGVRVSDFLEDSSVMLSFVAFKERDSRGMQTGRIVYSFAYGTPDLDFSDGILIALPRYLHHEAVLATRETLEKKIGSNIEEADRDFFRFLRSE